MTQLIVWVFGCSHVTHDVSGGFNTVRDAIADAEAVGFDIAVNLGDVTGLGLPSADDGAVWLSQVNSGLSSHIAEDIYSICGNHDRTAERGVNSGSWFRRFVDPLGEFPRQSGINKARRPYAINGDWQRYNIKIGNLRLLFISDINRSKNPGRSNTDGDPGGVVTSGTVKWWESQLSRASDAGEIAITFAHYLPRDTTTATGRYEGGTLDDAGNYSPFYHGPGSTMGKCSSYLAFVDSKEGRPFIDYMEQNPGLCALWVGAHNHVKPEKEVGGKGHVETLHGCTFIQNGALTRLHHSRAKERYPRSQFFTFTSGSSTASMRTYYHEDTDYSSRGLAQASTALSLPRAFVV